MRAFSAVIGSSSWFEQRRFVLDFLWHLTIKLFWNEDKIASFCDFLKRRRVSEIKTFWNEDSSREEWTRSRENKIEPRTKTLMMILIQIAREQRRENEDFAYIWFLNEIARENEGFAYIYNLIRLLIFTNLPLYILFKPHL